MYCYKWSCLTVVELTIWRQNNTAWSHIHYVQHAFFHFWRKWWHKYSSINIKSEKQATEYRTNKISLTPDKFVIDVCALGLFTGQQLVIWKYIQWCLDIRVMPSNCTSNVFLGSDRFCQCNKKASAWIRQAGQQARTHSDSTYVPTKPTICPYQLWWQGAVSL